MSPVVSPLVAIVPVTTSRGAMSPVLSPVVAMGLATGSPVAEIALAPVAMARLVPRELLAMARPLRPPVTTVPSGQVVALSTDRIRPSRVCRHVYDRSRRTDGPNSQAWFLHSKRILPLALDIRPQCPENLTVWLPTCANRRSAAPWLGAAYPLELPLGIGPGALSVLRVTRTGLSLLRATAPISMPPNVVVAAFLVRLQSPPRLLEPSRNLGLQLEFVGVMLYP